VQQIALLMCDSSVKPEEVSKAGVCLFHILLVDKDGDSLNSLCCTKFLEIVLSSAVVDPQKLRNSNRDGSSFSQFEGSFTSNALTNVEMQFDPKMWGWMLDSIQS